MPDDTVSFERRRSERFPRNVSVFVYGYTASQKPFHEESTTVDVSSRGGLLALAANVFVGQKLLLTNIANCEEQQCSVVRFARKCHQKVVAIVFEQAVPDFWQTQTGQSDQRNNATDAKLEWLLCLASALEACKRPANWFETVPPDSKPGREN